MLFGGFRWATVGLPALGNGHLRLTNVKEGSPASTAEGVFSSFIFFLWGGGMKNNRKCLLISKKLETLRVKDI